MSSASGMKCFATYSGSTWFPVNHRARFEVQAPHVRDSGLPSAAVKITSGLSSATALCRASVTLVSHGMSRHGLSPFCGFTAASSRSKSSSAISGTPFGTEPNRRAKPQNRSDGR